MSADDLSQLPIFAAQIRAARGLLNWSQAELSERSGVARRTITHIENETRDVQAGTRADIVETFERFGVRLESGAQSITVTLDRRPKSVDETLTQN
jgi:transcriptional regulator with XRE-family HTH domain